MVWSRCLWAGILPVLAASNVTVVDGFDLAAALACFARFDGGDQDVVDAFRRLAVGCTDADPYGRDGRHGHFTGSAFLVSADGRRAALMHHRKLDRWLQPGGHADGDRDLRRVALREATEETGLTGLTVAPAIFDLDRHWIPGRPGEPGHWHYDVRFVVRAGADEALRGNAESKALAWRDIATMVMATDTDASIRRMAARWLARA